MPSGAIRRYCRRLREIQTSQKAAECEERMKAFLILEDGTVFEGTHIGADKEIISEIVFNTSMAGYLEVLTDPSYAGQAVCMTCLLYTSHMSRCKVSGCEFSTKSDE